MRNFGNIALAVVGGAEMGAALKFHTCLNASTCLEPEIVYTSTEKIETNDEGIQFEQYKGDCSVCYKTCKLWEPSTKSSSTASHTITKTNWKCKECRNAESCYWLAFLGYTALVMVGMVVMSLWKLSSSDSDLSHEPRCRCSHRTVDVHMSWVQVTVVMCVMCLSWVFMCLSWFGYFSFVSSSCIKLGARFSWGTALCYIAYLATSTTLLYNNMGNNLFAHSSWCLSLFLFFAARIAGA